MKRFSIVNNGYDIDEVNRFIDIVIARMEKLNSENAALATKIEKLEKNSGNNNPQLEKAVLAIQEAGDKIKEMAREEAKMIVDEAKTNANSIVHEALVDAEKIKHTNMILEKNVKIYKERVKNLLEAELEIVEDLDKVELSEV